MQDEKVQYIVSSPLVIPSWYINPEGHRRQGLFRTDTCPFRVSFETIYNFLANQRNAKLEIMVKRPKCYLEDLLSQYGVLASRPKPSCVPKLSRNAPAALELANYH
jgi:hypothetical protein